ncbi:hypothetical protein AT251_23770 [Enterovibrio nigricans]|nr:hypothetical protein AT251_23770 [Enterovibrio nigricans]
MYPISRFMIKKGETPPYTKLINIPTDGFNESVSPLQLIMIIKSFINLRKRLNNVRQKQNGTKINHHMLFYFAAQIQEGRI